MAEPTNHPAHPGVQITGLGRFARFMPALAWLPGYRVKDLPADLLAGLLLAAYLIPSGIGDASLAGLPPQAGLYASLFPGLVFWIFCSSRQTAVSATSALSLVMGSSLGALAAGDASDFAALAGCTALLVAAIAFAAWLVKAGDIVNFASESVMAGFKTGVALFLISSQLPKLLGIKPVHGGFWDQTTHLLANVNSINPAAAAIGVGALVLLWVGNLGLKNRPVALLVLAGGIALGTLGRWEANGVAMLGSLPKGLPVPGFPEVGLSQIRELLPLAFACFLLCVFETAAIGRIRSKEDGVRFDTNQEFLALAGANLMGGLGRAFPVSGGISQSLVNQAGGARTPLSTLVAALVVLVLTVSFSGLLRNLPQPVVAAIVLFAAGGLFKLSALRHLWKASRSEFVVAMAALLGVLASGLLVGVLIGAIISLVLMLGRVSKPHVAFLGRIPGTRRFSDIARHPDNELIPGMLLFRVESDLFYFNVDYVLEKVMDRVRTADPPPRVVVCDLSTSASVDLAGAQMLATLTRMLNREGIHFHIVEAHGSVRDLLRAEGLEGKVGPIDRRVSLADNVETLIAEDKNEHGSI